MMCQETHFVCRHSRQSDRHRPDRIRRPRRRHHLPRARSAQNRRSDSARQPAPDGGSVRDLLRGYPRLSCRAGRAARYQQERLPARGARIFLCDRADDQADHGQLLPRHAVHVRQRANPRHGRFQHRHSLPRRLGEQADQRLERRRFAPMARAACTSSPGMARCSVRSRSCAAR